MRRVIAYIDGHNLYYGLRAKYGRRYHWLNVEALAESMLAPGHALVRVRYFTARVRNQPASARRQATYLTALASHCGRLHIVEGRFQERLERCNGRAAWSGRPTTRRRRTSTSLQPSSPTSPR